MAKYKCINNHRYGKPHNFELNKIFDENEYLVVDITSSKKTKFQTVEYYVKFFPEDWKLIPNKIDLKKYLEDIFFEGDNTVIQFDDSNKLILLKIIHFFDYKSTTISWEELLEVYDCIDLLRCRHSSEDYYKKSGFTIIKFSDIIQNIKTMYDNEEV